MKIAGTLRDAEMATERKCSPEAVAPQQKLFAPQVIIECTKFVDCVIAANCPEH